MTPLVALVIPLVGALAILLTGRWPNLREGMTLTTALALLAAVVSLALIPFSANAGQGQ